MRELKGSSNQAEEVFFVNQYMIFIAIIPLKQEKVTEDLRYIWIDGRWKHCAICDTWNRFSQIP